MEARAAKEKVGERRHTIITSKVPNPFSKTRREDNRNKPEHVRVPASEVFADSWQPAQPER